ncbi:hypothetical protein FRC02_004746 [Tulasnella sp. 418]|nr:hypothetical protein FRC02_004746 [Tulasnella sp. 418]
MNQEDAMHPLVDFEHSPADKVHRATQRIAMVCNRWYDMVISMPQLWSYLDATRSIETTTLRLRRSGLCSGGTYRSTCLSLEDIHNPQQQNLRQCGSTTILSTAAGTIRHFLPYQI